MLRPRVSYAETAVTAAMFSVLMKTQREGGDMAVVPWYQRGGTWYNIVQMWWNLAPKVGV